MLTVHLAQDDDLASRRTSWIDDQVHWIHDTLLSGRTARILDLGCGPGFYAHRLASLGHRCLGIDFGPASIEYARAHNPDPSRCEFVLGDVRATDFGGPYRLAMILYGELNTFSPADALALLKRVHAALEPQGIFITEAHSQEAVERIGQGETTEQRVEWSVFADHPHTYRTENEWHSERRVAVQRFTITESTGEPPREYHSTTQAWCDQELTELFVNAGFRTATRCGDWPCNTDDLRLWRAARG